jgi:GT2 family glycosyltransferase
MRLRSEQRQRLISGFASPLLFLGSTCLLRVAERLSPALAHEVDYRAWCRANTPDADELARQRECAIDWDPSPLVSVLMPVFRPDLPFLAAAIASLDGQTYPRWELCVAHAEPAGSAAADLIARLPAANPRIRVRSLPRNRGIAGNTNAALELAGGAFLLLLDQDDLLSPDALFHLTHPLRAEGDLDLVYSDSDLITPWGERYQPFFKPGWSPHLLLSGNYVAHATLIRRALVEALGGMDTDLDGAQDWDLVLRVAERSNRVAHVPRVLYHWRSVPTSCASLPDAKPYATAAQRVTIERALARRATRAIPDLEPPGVWRLRPLDGRHASSAEISLSPDADTKALDCAARAADSDLLLFRDSRFRLANGATTGDLALWARMANTGVVGGMIVAPAGRITCAGWTPDGRGRLVPVFDGCHMDEWTPAGSPLWYRDALVPPLAGCAVRRTVFERLGGLDTALAPDAALAEFALRCHVAGWQNICVPFCRFQAILPPFDRSISALPGSEAAGLTDPYSNPNVVSSVARPHLRTRTPPAVGPSLSARER